MSKSVTRIATIATTASAIALGISGLTGAGPAQATPNSANTTSASRASVDRTGWVGVERAQNARTAVIELVSPAGVHKSVLSVPKSEVLVQVSPDGNRVLTVQSNNNVSGTYRVHDLVGHRVSAFTGTYGTVRFTAPSGTALLAQPAGPNGVGNAAVERLDFSGHRQATYAGTTGNDFMPSLDGRFLVGTTPRGQVTVNANATGRLLRVVPSPKGLPYCTPLSSASASAVYVRCSGTSQSQVFRYALAGGSPVSVTSSLPAQPFGYVDYWTQPSGTWVQQGVGCGSGPLMKVTGRSVRRARLPIAGSLSGVAANNAYIENSECESGTTVSAVNLGTGKVTTLFTSTPARPVIMWTLIDPTR